jgi:glycerol-3-phosphate cytidylyltransferase
MSARCGYERQRIGYTAGVFDLFHVGHLNILRAARAQCDQLIVGVTSDELCLATKGKAPVMPTAERTEIVEAVRYVDRVVPQATRDKLVAWRALHYDVLFVGDDWQGTPTWNELERVLAERGAAVVYLPYTRHTSSTLLRARLTAHPSTRPTATVTAVSASRRTPQIAGLTL